MFSDQLIITEITILIAGFIQCSRISVYHLQIITRLTWLASNAHQTTLTIIRIYVHKHRPVLRNRMVAMSVISVTLFTMLVLSGASAELAIPSETVHLYLTADSPSACAWSRTSWPGISDDTVFSLLVLSIGFWSRVIKFSEKASGLCEKWLRNIPGEWLKIRCDMCGIRARATKSLFVQKGWDALAYLVLAIYVCARALYDIYGSILLDLLWLLGSLIYGIN